MNNNDNNKTSVFGLYDQEGHRVNYRKLGERSFEVWFHDMDPTKEEGCIWTGILDELVYEEDLEVKYIRS